MKKYFLSILIICVLASFQPKKKIWVALGDSITYLNDHLDETGNRVEKGYLTRVVEKLSEIEYVNRGFNGWTAGNVAAKINSLDIPKAEIYTVFLGTNDWWSSRPVGSKEDYKQNNGNSSFYGSCRIIIDKLRNVSPKAEIILITPMQRADFVYILDPNNNAHGSHKAKAGQKLADFASAVVEIGKMENLRVLNLFEDKSLSLPKLIKFKHLREPGKQVYKNYTFEQSLEIPFDPKKDDYPYPISAIGMTYDGLHPSDKGNQFIARRLISIFNDFSAQ